MSVEHEKEFQEILNKCLQQPVRVRFQFFPCSFSFNCPHSMSHSLHQDLHFSSSPLMTADLDAGTDAPAVSNERTDMLIPGCEFQHKIQVHDRSLISVSSFESIGETDAKSVSGNDGKSFK